MTRNEERRGMDHLKRIVPTTSVAPLLSRPSMVQTTSTVIPRLSIDPHAVDISSIKSRFAWEKIALGDTYMPVIFRGTIKYFCIRMLLKLLPEYPDDAIRRPSLYHYRQSIDLYVPTSIELELLNKINAHHSHWFYSRLPFTIADELVRVTDFIPFYEHLRLFLKTTPVPRIVPSGSLRPILSQPRKATLGSPDFVMNLANPVRGQLTLPFATTPIQMASELPRENTQTLSRPTAPIPSVLRPPRPPKYVEQPLAPPQQSPIYSFKQVLPPPIQSPIATSSSGIINSADTVRPNKLQTVPVSTFASKSTTPTLSISSSSPSSVISSPMGTNSQKVPVSSSEKQLAPISKQPSISSSRSSSPSTSKPPRPHSGWLQINKLYTPYVATNTADHHLYKIPVSLLTFYDLIKASSFENNTNESKDFQFEQTLVTPQEIELINELCLKQNIKPFSIDTKLIDLSIFYHYSSSNILFIKELPLNEPKASICKDWPSVVQINGGICRLRNITTLHEQTVPFIGNNLLKNFIISAQCLASASLTTPTASEIEFLQLILFFSNMSINVRNSKLIDIESVRKEYNVDLILLFNDKFPLNVLNYQQQDSRSSSSQGQVAQSESSAATNTFAESTPPPSPPSPPRNTTSTNPTSQLPLTSPSNRYQKPITFHGHPMTAYICSGLGSNAQRECISIKELCNTLYPNSSLIEKLETRMLRLLRLRNINRFRPQNQQSMGFTRLIDIKDIEKNWDFIEHGMRSLSNNDEEPNIAQGKTSSLSDRDLKASKLDKVEIKSINVEQKSSTKINKGEKRPPERDFEENDVPVMGSINKRVRFTGENNHQEQLNSVRFDNKSTHSDDDETDEEEDDDDDDARSDKNRRISTPSMKLIRRQTDKKNTTKTVQQQNEPISTKSSIALQKQLVPVKKKIKLTRQRPTPSIRSSKNSIAAWVKKYNVEECCVSLDFYDPVYETGKN